MLEGTDNRLEPQESSSAAIQKTGHASSSVLNAASHETRLEPIMSRLAGKRPELWLEIPPRKSEGSDVNALLNCPATAGAGRVRKGWIPRSISKLKASNLEMHQGDVLSSSSQAHNNSKVTMPSFWGHMRIPLSAKRTSSLPVTPQTPLESPSAIDGSLRGVPATKSSASNKLTMKGVISRSLSVPVQKARSLRRMESTGRGLMLVRPASLQTHALEVSIHDSKGKSSDTGQEEGEEIPEEEAVCRICMDDLHEGNNNFRIECACKGELALAHKECVVKWFNVKGNRMCDVCGQEVQNLPVVLVRVPTQNASSQVPNQPEMHRVWQDVPVLVMISMLGYFCFLEQLLVNDMGSGALAIALPFACILGFLASVTASTMVKKYIWVYAVFQFGLVILFSHLFYSLDYCNKKKTQQAYLMTTHEDVFEGDANEDKEEEEKQSMEDKWTHKIHVKPAVVAVLLASLSGFSLAMCCNTLYLQYNRWKRQQRRRASTGSESVRSSQRGGAYQNPEPPFQEPNFHDVERGR